MKRMIAGNMKGGRRMMACTLSASVLLLAGTPVLGQSTAAPKAEVGEAVCQLLDNCAGEAPAAAKPRGTPRVSSTRGFSLARPKADGTPAAAPAPIASGKPTKAASSVAKPVKNPVGAGRYDLRVTFRSGSAEVASAAKSRATVFAAALRDPRLAGRRVRIEGHTDSVGNAESNRVLSERRARAVADLLIAAGVDTGRLDVAGFGSTQPLSGIASTAGAQRRVVAVLVK